MTVRFCITRLQKKPRPKAGARIRHLGEDGLTGESIIRSQGLRPHSGPGSLVCRKITCLLPSPHSFPALVSAFSHRVLARPPHSIAPTLSHVSVPRLCLLRPQPCLAGVEQTAASSASEKMRPTIIGLRRYGMAQEPREHCLMPWETEDNRCLKKKVFRHRILVAVLSKLGPLPGNQSSYQLLPDADSATQEPGKQPRYRALSRVACAEHRSPPHFSRMSHLCEAKTVSVVWTTGSTGQ